MTAASGTCSLTKTNIKGNVAVVSFTVDTVGHASNTYDAGANHDPDGDSNGTTVSVPKPQGPVALAVSGTVTHRARIQERAAAFLVPTAISFAISANALP